MGSYHPADSWALLPDDYQPQDFVATNQVTPMAPTGSPDVHSSHQMAPPTLTPSQFTSHQNAATPPHAHRISNDQYRGQTMGGAQETSAAHSSHPNHQYSSQTMTGPPQTPQHHTQQQQFPPHSESGRLPTVYSTHAQSAPMQVQSVHPPQHRAQPMQVAAPANNGRSQVCTAAGRVDEEPPSGTNWGGHQASTIPSSQPQSQNWHSPVNSPGGQSLVGSGYSQMASDRLQTWVASPTPHSHQRRRTAAELDSQSLDSVPPSASVSNVGARSSEARSTSAVSGISSLSPSTFVSLQEQLNVVRSQQPTPDEILEGIQGLTIMPERERWGATLFLLYSIAAGNNNGGRPSAGADGHSIDRTDGGLSLNGYLRVHLRTILLRPDLQSYGRQSSGENHVVRTPYSLVKEIINEEDEEFRATHLLPGYPDNGAAVAALDKKIGDVLKGEKANFSKMIKDSLGTPTIPVQKLSKLVVKVYRAMHPRFKDVGGNTICEKVRARARGRLAYLRLIINLNHVQRYKNGVRQTKNFWTQIDEDLQLRCGKPKLYQMAFTELVNEKDTRLWDVTKTTEAWSEDDVRLPTTEEIEARMAGISGSTASGEGGDESGDEGGLDS